MEDSTIILDKYKKYCKKGCLRGCLIIVGSIFLLIIVAISSIFTYYYWGFWRPLSYNLTGSYFPMKKIYETDKSKDPIFAVEVYQLPANLQERLNEKKIDLSQYPMFCGIERDNHYKRINWTHSFPQIGISIYHDLEENIFLENEQTVESVSSFKKAKSLVLNLLSLHDTWTGGWYRLRGVGYDSYISDYDIYILNIEKAVLIRFMMNDPGVRLWVCQ